MDFKKDSNRRFQQIVSAPFIYGMIFPLAFLDITIEIYHRICFPLYGLKTLDRSKYIRIDRHRLDYLNALEKVNCAYCGYANGLLRYSMTIAAHTEQYWCGIRHKSGGKFKSPRHHQRFLAYGDKKEYDKFSS